MGRQVRDAILDTRNARRALKQRAEPYWRSLDRGLHLGYRRRANGGSWIVRWFNESGTYIKHKLGITDDFGDADNVKTLNYKQAQEAARQWVSLSIRKERGLEVDTQSEYTVAEAMCDYLAQYKMEGKGFAVTQSSINAHILPIFGKIPVDRLNTKRIAEWHHSVASKAARLRTRKTAVEHKVREIDSDSDAIRKRRATANRILTIFKAALNYAWREGKVANDTAWRRVKPFRNVAAPVIRYLSEAECNRLVNACSKGFRKMVKAALFTGCRYGELTHLKVSDLNLDSGTVAIRTSKSGKPRHIVLTEEGMAFFEAAIMGKNGSELILTHENGQPWGKSHQSRPLSEACKVAKIIPAISFHILRHTHGSLLAMKGVPLPVIAKQLGHSDTRMTEKHYAHISPNYVAETIRQKFPKLGLMEAPSKIDFLKPVERKTTRGTAKQAIVSDIIG